MLDALQAAHEEKNATVVLAGEDLAKWAPLLRENPELGDGNEVTHVTKEAELLKRLLTRMPVPGIDCLMQRPATEEEVMLEQDLKKKREAEGIVSDEDGDDDADDDDDDGGDAGGDY